MSTHAISGQLAIPAELVERRIYLIRGHKVMIDSDLADLYQVATGNLNLAVRRNADRFPEDFMFQLTEGEFEILSLQTAISRWGGRRYLPFAFTEHGVAMLFGGSQEQAGCPNEHSGGAGVCEIAGDVGV